MHVCLCLCRFSRSQTGVRPYTRCLPPEEPQPWSGQARGHRRQHSPREGPQATEDRWHGILRMGRAHPQLIPVSEAKIGKYVAFLSVLCRTAAWPSHAEACTGPPMQHIMMCFVLATVPAGLLCAAPHAQGERRAARQAFPPLSPPQRLERLPTWQAKRYKLWPRRSDVLLTCARF